ncbi:MULTISPECIES: Kdo hydroxylase family protein [Legionella]|uniref:3-deoxy-D-manno-oct-2-ulosonic acid (Kdo) hydroxylase n=1 Tax=Legionella maceachernii TaxID=466 RepID=A0A0W0W0P0_9GAMM|nr:Kdo hydroxylase family protein [Legionella maceachernii]KTD25866.1 hypothetical protein Lmac_1637 [Legionella maceachernii]SJZ47300.1 3-deoxy-D-manno-oct-2-ulosonic acid (Kdo) hydroxylase [Legionella maceachernii]SUP03925.1 Protein of uncharacterised function (DUF2843) [Legionella maceachernii]
MDQQLHTLAIEDLYSLNTDCKKLAVTSLESGKVIYLPSCSFPLQPKEKDAIFSDKLLDGKHKNVSFDYRTKRLGGFHLKHDHENLADTLKSFMARYAEFAKQLIDFILPHYQDHLHWGRTSYRPAEIKGRTSSKRKDDTRLHVDSFPATPVNGKRILRVFSNINPFHVPRVWHLGEPFPEVLKRFAADIPNYSRTHAKLLQLIKATKTLRSAYDHYQLNLHDSMKLCDEYQQTVTKQRIDFPAKSTWIVFTDQVSHAALSGQFLLEQTFYLPVEAMATPELSPLKQWENEKAALLV